LPIETEKKLIVYPLRLVFLRIALRRRPAERVSEVCIVPVAFVSDHVETLGEIDHEARELAERLGFTQFEMSAGLNDSPKFIRALGQIVMETLGVAPRRVQDLQAETGMAVAG